jgi:uncharacterized membrane protein
MFSTSHLHPMIVHFPIALITIGFFADVVFLFFRDEKCLSKTGFYLMVLGALAAVAAWSTGQLFTSEPDQGEIVKTFENHKLGALITMIIMLIGATVRIYLVAKKKEDTNIKWLAFALYLMGFGAVTFTGLMGGSMVYNFMLGV